MLLTPTLLTPLLLTLLLLTPLLLSNRDELKLKAIEGCPVKDIPHFFCPFAVEVLMPRGQENLHRREEKTQISFCALPFLHYLCKAIPAYEQHQKNT